MGKPLTRELVVATADRLPGFPPVIGEILETLDDPDANTRILSKVIQLDPVIAARVLAQANVAASRLGRGDAVSDIAFAVSLIGMNSVRRIALASSVGAFLEKMSAGLMAAELWRHSIAAGVCSEELANDTAHADLRDAALIAGLLHDVGQLWLIRFAPDSFANVLKMARQSEISIDGPERDCFGVDHAVIGGWLAEHWALPEAVVTAIRLHHHPDSGPVEPLTGMLHVAEVLSHALDLGGNEYSRVTYLSSNVCTRLGISWDDGSRHLFGRIEGRTRHLVAMLETAG